MLTLVLPSPSGEAPRRVSIDRDVFTLGTHPESDVVLPRGTVDRRHCEIARKEGAYVVTDLHTTHGTWLNGQRVTTAVAIGPGDVLTVGELTVIVASSG